ncbi:MAG TPA: hypothetical protein VKA21_11935 [Candidatus Binatia bacterium]|nr:hypothetical protein [Candidatus Binatia bacterium]
MRALVLCSILAFAGAAIARPARLAKPKRGFQMQATDYTIAPGQDLEWCEYRRLPNTKPMDINGFKLRMPEGAHHFVIWAYGGDTEDDAQFPAGPQESVACTGLAPDDPIPQVLIPIQTPNARLRFPKGVALRIDPQQQIWLNPHMKNLTGEPITTDIRFNFYRARKGSVKHLAEGLIAGNSAAIRVPAGGDQTITAEWTAPADLNLIQLATHQHRLGTYANIELVNPDGTPRLIYENTNWQHPKPYWPAQPIRLAQGEKIRITCRWHNTDDHEVRFGPETTDEMCFILGFYYRDPEDTDPISARGCLPAKRGLLCPNAPAILVQ